MKTLEDHWHTFETQVIEHDASAERIEELKAVFFSGVMATLDSFERITVIAGDDVDLGAHLYDDVTRECRKFFQEYIAKK